MCIIVYCVTFTDDSIAANDRCRIVMSTQLVSYFLNT